MKRYKLLILLCVVLGPAQAQRFNFNLNQGIDAVTGIAAATKPVSENEEVSVRR